MEIIARRKFCGMGLLSLPLLCLRADGGEYSADQPDPIIDTLADEITRIAVDGTQNGFKAEHYRRCAGVIRTFDARLEEKGANRDVNRRLDDEDDFYRLNPSLTAQMTVDYWERHGVHLSESDLEARLTGEAKSFREMKKHIKRLGGIRELHASYVEALERVARENAVSAFRGGAVMRNGFLTFPSQDNAGGKFMSAQFSIDMNGFDINNFDVNNYDINALLTANRDCLCRAMIVEGVILAVACLGGCAPCCVPSAFILALEQFFEGMGLCSPSRC